MINIPGFSLNKQNLTLKNHLLEELSRVIDNGGFILGENVKLIEESIAEYCGAAFGIGVASGSDALYLSLLACGISPETEVITTPFTFFATAGSIERAGAKPVFVDIDPETWNINPSLIEEKISLHTKAIIPVHLYGCPSDMNSIMEVAHKYDLKVIEDAAQAIGALYRGKKVGSFGEAGCLSFFPTKNLGAFGDGGMVVTSNREIAERVRLLRVHGAKPKYYHQVLGCNSRLDELQAVILRIKFPYLEEWSKRRRKIASIYQELLSNLEKDKLIKLPGEPERAYHVYHQYTVQTDKRDELKVYLKEHGVGTAIYYPLPLHLQKVFNRYGYRQGEFPVAEAACRQVLSLPMYPELTDGEVQYVAQIINNFFKK